MKGPKIHLFLPFDVYAKNITKVGKATLFKSLNDAKNKVIDGLLTNLDKPTKFTADASHKDKPGAGSMFYYSKIEGDKVTGALIVKDAPSDYLRGLITNDTSSFKQWQPMMGKDGTSTKGLSKNAFGNIKGERRIFKNSKVIKSNGDTYMFGKTTSKAKATQLYKLNIRKNEQLYDFEGEAKAAVFSNMDRHFKDELKRLDAKIRKKTI